MKKLISAVLLFALFNLAACAKTFDDASTTTAPVVGTTITFSNKTSTSFTVTWGAATDDTTAAAALQYKMVYSASNNITTVAEALANGTVKLDWTANILTTNMTGLTAVTPYYVAVLVKDGDGNMALDKSSTTTLCSGKIMFLANVANGNFGGSVGADSICNANKPTGFASSTFKAMLGDGSVRAACYAGGNDNCSASVVGRAGWVFTPSEKLCTSDYATLIGTTNANSLLQVSNPNTLSSVTTTTFTGFNIAWGNSTSNNCSNWSSTAGSPVTGTASGIEGGSTHTFIANGGSATCNSAGTIYCVEQ